MAHSKTNLDKPVGDQAAHAEQAQPTTNDSPVGAEVIGLSLEPAQLRFDEDDEEMARRIRGEAERLANQSEFERNLWMEKRAQELGFSPPILRSAVNAVVRELAAAQKKREQEERALARREKERERQRAKQAEKQQRKAEKEAAQKQKERTKALAALTGFPVARQEAGLQRLATRLGEDIAVLKQELTELVGAGEPGGQPVVEETDPWPKPVKTAVVLQELQKKIAKHVVMQPNQLTAVTLWAAHCWTYDHEVPTHSPILAFTSAEPATAKSTSAVVVGFATPRHMLSVEITGPSLFRIVDATKPTLIMDDVDNLFVRKPDLRQVVNEGWTRGGKVPRMVKHGNAWVSVSFDVFTPKMITLVGRKLPGPIHTRTIEIRMLPKRSNEKVAPFEHLDDAEFATLRRKLSRWAADNAAALKGAKPAVPAGVDPNREGANWKLLLAIADLAGSAWGKKARAAAEQLSGTGRRPSLGVELLKAFQEIFTKQEQITSEDVVEHLLSDPTAIWTDCNHGGAVSQRLVAVLLDAYDIKPDRLPLRGGHRQRGYRREQFADAFARYLPKQVSKRPARKAKTKRK